MRRGIHLKGRRWIADINLQMHRIVICADNLIENGSGNYKH